MITERAKVSREFKPLSGIFLSLICHVLCFVFFAFFITNKNTASKIKNQVFTVTLEASPYLGGVDKITSDVDAKLARGTAKKKSTEKEQQQNIPEKKEKPIQRKNQYPNF